MFGFIGFDDLFVCLFVCFGLFFGLYGPGGILNSGVFRFWFVFFLMIYYSFLKFYTSDIWLYSMNATFMLFGD